ncbi:major facilitator superfamily domain-containing protein [Halteromyces radiatus]|uniref:major facilitator superfamily domain-containing protein n=1 Tax=Halteromyces radiatus TaxID=101107 RepID=UPI00221E9E89|nr:major facilitator superfamily domain-containing protein [Halteromyces radiatus]KAI8084763.1 major facilitator superfamily domain-containing protein [Halteromyces radiatus]
MQNYYEQHVFIDLPNAVIQLSFVGTLALSFMRLMGPVAQLMEPWIGHKGVLVIGCLCKAIGMLMAGFATQVYQLYLFQGLLFGCGSSLMYYTSLTLTPQWFTKRKGLALGIVASGSGIGGLVVPFIMTSINSRLGPSWTYRILGFICLAMDLSACILIKQNPTFQSEKKKKKLSDIIQLNVLRDIDYVLWVIGSDIVLLGYFIPFYFLPSYGHYVGLTDAQGAVLVSISSAFNFVGRATTGYCADYLGQLNTNILFTLVGGLSCLLIWTFAYNFGALIGFSIVFGLFCGAYFSLLSPITMLILGKDRFPTGLSLLLIFNIIGVFGPNIASAIETSLLRSVGPAYQPFLSYKLFAGICYLVGVLVFVFLRFRINKNWRTLL